MKYECISQILVKKNRFCLCLSCNVTHFPRQNILSLLTALIPWDRRVGIFPGGPPRGSILHVTIVFLHLGTRTAVPLLVDRLKRDVWVRACVCVRAQILQPSPSPADGSQVRCVSLPPHQNCLAHQRRSVTSKLGDKPPGFWGGWDCKITTLTQVRAYSGRSQGNSPRTNTGPNTCVHKITLLPPIISQFNPINVTAVC